MSQVPTAANGGETETSNERGAPEKNKSPEIGSGARGQLGSPTSREGDGRVSSLRGEEKKEGDSSARSKRRVVKGGGKRISNKNSNTENSENCINNE